MTRPSLGALVAILLVACAYAWPMQGRSLGELSNYALVKALVSGEATIDRTRFQVGDVAAGDFRTYHGHVYSDKAPGLAFATVPAYIMLRALGMRTTGDPTRALWALRLWAAALPAALLLLIVHGLAERIAPGFGTATAVTVGTGTLILPFATLFYSHVLSALLLVTSFALLWAEREGSRRRGLLIAGGLLVGYATATDYPSALAVLVFGTYVVTRRPRLRRGLVYTLGVLIGIAPLFVYDQWAFGSVTHLSYFGEELSSGTLEGRLDPSLINGLFTFVSLPGLLVLSPVLACGLVGLALLFAQGWRAEAVAIGSLLGALVVYNASLPGVEYDAFLSGPRYLVPILPLVALPLALVFRIRPLTTAALALVSIILMSVMTAAQLHRGARAEPAWFGALVERDVPQTTTSLAGVTGWYAIIPMFVAIAAALVVAAASVRFVDPVPGDPALAGLVVLAWAAGAALAPAVPDGSAATYAGYVPVLLILLAVGAVAALASIVERP